MVCSTSPDQLVIRMNDIKHAAGAQRTFSSDALKKLCGDAGGTLEELKAQKVDWTRVFE